MGSMRVGFHDAPQDSTTFHLDATLEPLAQKSLQTIAPLDAGSFEERTILIERMASRVRFVGRYVAHVNEKVEFTKWLIRRGRGLPELTEVSQSVSQSAAPDSSHE